MEFRRLPGGDVLDTSDGSPVAGHTGGRPRTAAGARVSAAGARRGCEAATAVQSPEWGPHSVRVHPVRMRLRRWERQRRGARAPDY